MPDIFDTLPSSTQLQRKAPTGPPPKDIFDHVASAAKPNALARARARVAGDSFPDTDTLAAGYDPAQGHTDALEVLKQAEGSAATTHSNFMQDIRGRIAADNASRLQAELDQQNPLKTAFNAFQQGTANTIIKGVAHVANLLPGDHLNDNDMARVNRDVEDATQQQFPNDPNLLSAKVGRTAADLAPVVLAPAAAPFVMTAQGAENRQEDVENRRAGGQTITPAQQHQYLAGGALLDFGLGTLAPGGAANKAILDELPAVANPFLNAAKNVAVSGATAAPEMGVYQAGSNALRKFSGVNPDQNIGEGVPQAMVTGLGLGAIGTAAHEAIGHATGTSKGDVFDHAATQAESEAPVAPLAPHTDAEMAQLVKAAAEQPPAEQAAPPQPETNPLRSAREQEYVRLQQYAKENGLPVPDLTPGLHTDDVAKSQPEQPVPNVLAAIRANVERGGSQETPSTAGTDNGTTHGVDAASDLFKRLASDEAGSVKGVGPFIKQDVVPATNRVVSASKQIAVAIDRDMNLGITTTPKGKQTALDLRKMQGDAEAAGHAFESQIAPYREHVPSFRDNPKDALIWADQVEASGTAPNKESQPAADALLAMRKQNAERAAKLGINNLDAEGLGLSRLFKPAEGKIGKGNSLAGTNKPFFHQKYDTFSDAYTAASKSGLMPAYDNPLDMQIARQYEVEKNLAARENIRKADTEGTIKWVPEGEKPEPQFDAKLTDPLLARETRRLAAPSWMVGKLSQLSHFEAMRYLDEIKPHLVDVKPGEEPPQGYAFTGKEQAGTFHAPSDTARFFNNALNHGVGDPISKLGSTVARTALQMRYLMSASHGMAAMMSNAGFHMGQVFKGLMAGDTTGAGRSMLDALNPVSGLRRGHELRQELENPGTHPQLSDVAQRIQAINPGLKLRSVLDRSTYDNAIESFKNGNPIGGTGKMVAAALKLVGDTTYNHVLPNIMAGALRNVAESDVRAGKSEPQGRANMAQASDTLAHLIGHHVKGNEFSAGVEKTVGRMIFPAYDLMRGQVENFVGGVTGRNPHALAALAGQAAITAIASGIAQMAYTYATTGKVIPPSGPRDFWNPRTGRTDASGHEERLTLPGMMPFILKMVGMAGGTQGIGNEVHGRLNPLISGGMETVANKDFQGNQVRPTGASTAHNFAAGVAHTLKGTLPIAGASQFDNPTGKPMTWDEHLGKALGVQYGHPVTSEAEQAVYDILDRTSGVGRTPDQERTRQHERDWVERLRSGEDEDKIADEMDQDPQMSPSKGKSIFRRAAEKQGLPGLLADERLGAPDLLAVWNKATNQEKAAIKDTMEDRLDASGKRFKSLSPVEQADWDALYDAVKAKD